MFLGPTTACSLQINGAYLYGNGSALKCHVSNDSKDFEIQNLFLPKGAVIHGIRAQGRLLFGGRHLALRRIDGSVYLEMFPEAVLDAQIVRNDAMLVAFSSGKISRIDRSTTRVISKPDLPLQYLAMRFSTCLQYVAAGSVMGNLHVWSVETTGKNRSVENLVGHKGAVFAQRFMPATSNVLVTGGEDRTVRLWKRLHGKMSPFTNVWTAYGPTARVWDCDFWSQGVVSVGEDSVCRIWDFEGNSVKEIYTGARNLYCLDVKNDIVLCGGYDSRVHEFDLALLPRCATPPASKTKKHDNLITSMRGADYVNAKWEWNSNVALEYPGKRGIVKCILELDNNTLLVGTSLGRLIRFNRDGKCIDEDQEAVHRREITVLERCGDQLMVTCSGDGVVALRTFADGKLVGKLVLQSSPTCAVFLNYNQLAVGDSFGNVFVLRLNQQRNVTIESAFWRAHGLMAVTCLQLLQGSNEGFISGGRNGNVLEYTQIDSKFAITGVKCKLGGISQVELICEHLVMGTLGEKLICFDTKRALAVLETCEFKRPFQSHNGKICFAGDDGTVQSIALDPVLHGRTCATTRASTASHFKMIWTAAFINDEQYVTVSEDETLRLWNFPQELVCTVDTPQISVRAIACSKDQFAVCGNGGLVQCYLKSNRMQLLAEHRPMDDGQVRMMCLDYWNTANIVTGGSDGYVFVYELSSAAAEQQVEIVDGSSTGNKRRLPAGNKLKPTLTTRYSLQRKHQFGNGTRAILCLKVIRNWVLCGETDGTLKIWNLDTHALLLTKQVQFGGAGLNCMDAIEDGGDRIVVWTGGDDQSVARVVLRIVASEEMLEVVKVKQFEDMAAAGITGIHIISTTEVVFVGADQRFTRIRIDEEEEEIVDLMEQSTVNVGDVSGLAVHGNRTVIVGLGLEVFQT